MTLYHYVPTKGALLDGLVELVVAAVRPALVGSPTEGPTEGPADDPTEGPADAWPALLRGFAVAFRAEPLRRPGVIPLVATRPVGTPDALRTVEETAAALGRAGLPTLAAAVAGGLGTPADHQARFDLALDALLTGPAAACR
ncbi:hypothetical protein AB0K43_04875 [Kitasatospora sp. NPDC049258]|uniref:hypothetical protein n=1 Tax=Kitasatospora sp. NPDC049258 TaxID=3155394 RepID=UPI0034404F93